MPQAKDQIAIALPPGFSGEVAEALKPLDLLPAEAGRLFCAWLVMNPGKLPFEAKFIRTRVARESMFAALDVASRGTGKKTRVPMGEDEKQRIYNSDDPNFIRSRLHPDMHPEKPAKRAPVRTPAKRKGVAGSHTAATSKL